MSKTTTDQWSIAKYAHDTHLLTWLEAFLMDMKTQGSSKGILHFYKYKLNLFVNYCQAQVITHIPHITPNLIRSYLLHLEETGHNEEVNTC